MDGRDELQHLARMAELNSKRLEQVIDQISRLEIVQTEHSDVEAAMRTMAESENPSTMIPIGAGVHLTPQNHTGDTAVVDIGSGIHAELPFLAAAEIIHGRIIDLGQMIDELKKESTAMESRIMAIQEDFNNKAGVIPEVIDDQPSSDGEPESEPTSSSEDTKPRRRRGIGGELTLDD